MRFCVILITLSLAIGTVFGEEKHLYYGAQLGMMDMGERFEGVYEFNGALSYDHWLLGGAFQFSSRKIKDTSESLQLITGSLKAGVLVLDDVYFKMTVFSKLGLGMGLFENETDNLILFEPGFEIESKGSYTYRFGTSVSFRGLYKVNVSNLEDKDLSGPLISVFFRVYRFMSQ